MSSSNRVIFPAIQLGSAGLAFICWMYLSETATVNFQETPIRVLAFGTALSLTITLGLSYVLPNLYRGHEVCARRKAGPWSAALGLSIAMCIIASFVGASIAGIFRSGPGQVFGLSMSMGALIAIGVLAAQVGRVNDSIATTILGGVATPSVPIVWVLANELGLTKAESDLGFVITMSLIALVLALALSPGASLRNISVPNRLGSTLRAGVLLIPHLLCFGALMQGLRISASAGTDDAALLASHRIMLVLSIGLTIVASFGAYYSSQIQSTDDRAYERRRRGFTKNYALVGAACGILCGTVTVVLAREGSVGFARLDWLEIVAIASIPASVGNYYAFSVHFVRQSMTWPLGVASSSALGIFLVGSQVLGGAGIRTSLFVYALVLAAMPWTLVALSRLKGAKATEVRLDLATMASYLSLPVLALISWAAL